MKNPILTSLIIFLAATLGINAQSIQNPDDFDQISISVPATVYLSIGSTSIRFEGDSDDIEELETEIKGGKLDIRKRNNKSWGWSSSDDIKIYISTPQVNDISLSGSGTIEGKSKFKSSSMKISLSGSGDINLDVDADELKVYLTGSGDINLKGSGNDASAMVTGSGDIDMKNCEVKNMDAKVTGSGDLLVYVTQSLNSSIMGSGDIGYKGNPDKVNNNTMGSGDLEKIND
ncbi:head GIN domain-containing protein [Marinigracilibium pacificum]|uniref:DUF2807 domain-containing protein n=1 Tax=Marinigracilibium pacificum TaxID=2729599 RepID=A0A848J2D6_9BACT|nr:head GIN domain-containing protein [Marinigracilibium pacificum]NMM48644.1 DUF2807 domain-containing protein [Marinigracilibium pacificum]